MSKMIKKYIPYAVIILAVYMLCPLFFVFTGDAYQAYTPIIYDVVFPVVAIVCSVIYARSYGIDFFFSLVAPIIYIPSMIIYNGLSVNNIIFVAIYLVSSIFGLFLGDMLFSQKDKGEAPLDVDLDIEEEAPQINSPAENMPRMPANGAPEIPVEPDKAPKRKAAGSRAKSDDDFFESYSSDTFTDVKANAEDEIDRILKEIHNKD